MPAHETGLALSTILKHTSQLCRGQLLSLIKCSEKGIPAFAGWKGYTTKSYGGATVVITSIYLPSCHHLAFVDLKQKCIGKKALNETVYNS